MPLSLIKAIAKWLRTGLTRAGLPEDALQLIEDTSRETTKRTDAFKPLCGCADPKRRRRTDPFGSGKQHLPVIETGTGNCHIFCR